MDYIFPYINYRLWHNNNGNFIIKTRHQQNRHFQTDEII